MMNSQAYNLATRLNRLTLSGGQQEAQPKPSSSNQTNRNPHTYRLGPQPPETIIITDDAGNLYISPENNDEHPGADADPEKQKKFNEEHGLQSICANCQAMRWGCNHAYPCSHCKREGIICRYSKAQHAQMCNYGIRCHELHQLQYNLLKKFYNVNLDQIATWVFPRAPASLGKTGQTKQGLVKNKNQLPEAGIALPRSNENPFGYVGNDPPDWIYREFIQGTWRDMNPQGEANPPPPTKQAQPAPPTSPQSKTTSATASASGSTAPTPTTAQQAGAAAVDESKIPAPPEFPQFKSMKEFRLRAKGAYRDWVAQHGNQYYTGPGSSEAPVPDKSKVSIPLVFFPPSNMFANDTK